MNAKQRKVIRHMRYRRYLDMAVTVALCASVLAAAGIGWRP